MTLILTIDNGSVTALTLLDLSATFDTTNHNILIRCLSTRYSIFCIALTWYSSYLTDRRQAIKIGNCFSDMLPTSSGVLQRSVLGPLVFHHVYNALLSSAIQRHNLDHHLYAIDTCKSTYISLTTPNTFRSLDQFRNCRQGVSLWIRNSKLKLNNTTIIIICSSTQRAKLDSVFPTHILRLIECHTINLSLTSRSND